MKTFSLKIISKEKTIYDGSAELLIVPCESGYLGVLADHAPLIGNLKAGKITIKDAQGRQSEIDLNDDGSIEVLKNNVKILL